MSDTLSPQQIARLDNCVITLKPVTLPAFGEGKGHWTNYDAVQADGITEITVEPCITGEALDGDTAYVDIRCTFDPEEFPSEKYNIVYGDAQFERALDAHIRKVFGIPQIGEEDGYPDHMIIYTESGMQGDDEISSEARMPFRMHLASLSNHALLNLTKSDQIEAICVGDFAWQSSSAET